MAFRRRARNVRRRPTTTRRRTHKPTLRRTVRRMINRHQETKTHYLNETEVTMPITTGAITKFPLLVPQGVNKHQRIGNSITPVGLDIRGHVNVVPQSGNTFVIRMLVIKKKSPLDSFIANGFENNAGNFGPLSNTLADVYARVNTDRYQVLFNKVMTIGYADQNVASIRMFKHYIPIKYKVQFDEGTADPVQGQTEIIWFTRDAFNDGSSGSAELTYSTKFYYKDA